MPKLDAARSALLQTVRPLEKLKQEARETVAGLEKRKNEVVDSFVDRLPEPFRTAPGQSVDVFNASKDWMSDRVFQSLKGSEAPEALKGPQRVAYGPLDAPPKLKRPLVMIPGLTMAASSYDRLGNQLATNRANGPVVVYVAAEDAFRLGDKSGRKLSNQEARAAKIFQVEFQDPWASPTKKAPQIERALARISTVTKQGDVDVVAHSAGATDFRLYLDERGEGGKPRIQNAAFIGPASHGTYLGNIGQVAGHPLKNVDEASRELSVGSKMIQDLNANWQRQRDQVQNGITIIGTTGTPTLGPAKGLFEDGDGYMPTSQLGLPGADLVLMEGPHNTPLAHLWQVQYSGVVNAAMKAISG